MAIFTNMEEIFKNNGAHFDETRTYRYALWRTWDESKPKIMFVGLNPSTANENDNDPTIRRVISFAQKWGYGSVFMVNLFPFVTTYPSELEKNKKNINENDEFVKMIASHCEKIVFAWGNFKEATIRGKEMAMKFPTAYALQINKNGTPKHPLYVRGDFNLIHYKLEF